MTSSDAAAGDDLVAHAAAAADGAPAPGRAGDGATFHIGAIAEIVGLSLRSVRYYEEQGLIEPEGRTTGGFRLYSERQVERLRLIMQMKPLGFSLDEMRALLAARATANAPDSTDDARAAAREELAGFADHADRRIAKLRRAIDAGEELAAALRAESA